MMGVDLEIQRRPRLGISCEFREMAASGRRFPITAVLILSFLSGPGVFAQSPVDLAAGEALFENCAFCHGAQGQGNQQADAPKLTGRQADYLIRQLQNFKNGVRGDLPVDIPGNQMALMSTILVDDAAIRNVRLAQVENCQLIQLGDMADVEVRHRNAPQARIGALLAGDPSLQRADGGVVALCTRWIDVDAADHLVAVED